MNQDGPSLIIDPWLRATEQSSFYNIMTDILVLWEYRE